jgi:hypothetical protein
VANYKVLNFVARENDDLKNKVAAFEAQDQVKMLI